MNENLPIGQPSVDTQVLAKHLKTLKSGDVVTYGELGKIIGPDSRHPKFKGYLVTARRIVLREHSLVFEPMSGDDRGVGLVALSDAQKLDLPQLTLKRIRRTCRTAASKVATADYEKLSSEEQRKFSTGLSVLGAVEMFTKPNTLARIEGGCAVSQKKLSFDQTISLFQTK